MTSPVSVRKCADYEPIQIQQALSAALQDISFSAIRPGMKVLVKPNLVIRRGPDRHCTTHPEVLIAVIKALQQMGATVILAETPGGPLTHGLLMGLYEQTGMRRVAEETGCILNEDLADTLYSIPQGKILRQQKLLSVLSQVDAVVSVGKLKTHGLTCLTGCVKNLFGLVPGLTKVEAHSLFPEREEFSETIVDLCEHIRPVLNILDAVWGLEGDGPTAGNPRFIGALVVGENPHAVDAVGAQLVGVAPMDVTTLACAEKRGLVPEIALLGDPWQPLTDLRLPDALVTGSDRVQKRFRAVSRYLGKFTQPLPDFSSPQCVGCGVCQRSCPGKAIEMRPGRDGRPRPHLHRKKCIHCFCCQELCPSSVVQIRRSALTRFIR